MSIRDGLEVRGEVGGTARHICRLGRAGSMKAAVGVEEINGVGLLDPQVSQDDSMKIVTSGSYEGEALAIFRATWILTYDYKRGRVGGTRL